MKEISKQLKCILLRGDIELWLEDSFVENLKQVLFNSNQSKFIEIGDQVINTADIVGILTPETMENKTRRKNGQWKCSSCGDWIDKFKTCEKCEFVKIPEYAKNFNKK